MTALSDRDRALIVHALVLACTEWERLAKETPHIDAASTCRNWIIDAQNLSSRLAEEIAQ